MPKKLIVVSLLFLLMMSAAGFAQTLVYDAVFVTEFDGQSVSVSKDACYEMETGYLFTSEYVIMTDLFGILSTIRHDLTVEMDQDYAVVAAREERELDDLSAVYELTVDYGSSEPLVFISITEQGVSQTEVHVLEPGQKLHLPDTALLMIADTEGLVPGTVHEFLFLDTAEFRPVPGSFVVGEHDTYTIGGMQFEGFVVQFELEDTGVMNVYCDEKGWGHYYTASAGFYELIGRKVEDDEIPDLTTSPLELTTFDAGLFVAYPLRSVRSRIALSIPDLAAVQLEDNRQKIIEQQIGDGTVKVLLEISKDSRSRRGEYQLPITLPELEPYLGSDRYIDPTLPEIQALAAEILQGETDAWVSTARLVQWVFNCMKPALTAVPRTTAQILANPTGSCKEHAILFAALARAAGIPTRLAMGLRYSEGFLMGHMWNEVWLGEWIAVDPSHGQLAPDALMIKLIDSDAVSGMTLQMGSILSDIELAIKLVDTLFRHPKVPLETGVSGQTFTNAEYAFSITLPDQWSFLVVDELSYTSFLALSNNQLASMLLGLSILPPGTDIRRIIELEFEAVLEELGDYILYEPEGVSTTVIAGYDAFKTNWGLDMDGLLIYQEMIMLMVDDMLYSFAFTVPAMVYEHFADTFAQILDSIEIHW